MVWGSSGAETCCIRPITARHCSTHQGRSSWVRSMYGIPRRILCIPESPSSREELRAAFGHLPARYLTYITHAFLHASFAYAFGNIFFLLFFGIITELKIGKIRYLSVMMFMAVFGAWFAAIYSPSYWPDNPNPVGISIVVNCLVVMGSYSAVQAGSSKVMSWVLNLLKRDSQHARVALFAGFLGYTAGIACLAWILGSEYTAEDEVVRIGHSIGAVTGGLLLLCSVLPKDLDHFA